MTERAMRIVLVVMAAVMLLSLFGALAIARVETRPDDPAQLMTWTEDHPADWEAANALTESALDLDAPTRFDIWRRAHEHALMLAPLRAATHESFVRSGFFHWYELPESDRRKVLAEAQPILRDRHIFYTLAPVIWQLTHDFRYLQRASGGDYTSLARLRDIAATNGLFADYQLLRDQASRRLAVDFANKADEGAPFDALEYVRIDCTKADEPLLVRVLEELHVHPIEKMPSNPAALDRLIDYALRHHLQPIDGLAYAVRDPASAAPPERARLAVALGDLRHASLIETATGLDLTPTWHDYFTERAAYERAHGQKASADGYTRAAAELRTKVVGWSGRCGEEICTAAHRLWFNDAPRPYAMTLARSAADEVPPYAEIYVDDERIGEAAVAGEETFTSAPLAPGLHRVNVRVVNPFTRNLAQRRVRVLRESP